jgi:hypothetical protein
MRWRRKCCTASRSRGGGHRQACVIERGDGQRRAAIQVFGGYGCMNECAVGRFYCDAKILEIGEGTGEVQRMLIACQLGL